MRNKCKINYSNIPYQRLVNEEAAIEAIVAPPKPPRAGVPPPKPPRVYPKSFDKPSKAPRLSTIFEGIEPFGRF